MSVIIIIGGDDGKNAIDELVKASTTMNPEQRAVAQQLLLDFTAQVDDLLEKCK